MNLNKTVKTSNDKIGKSYFYCLDGSAVMIENLIIHTYYQMNISLLMNE